MKVCAQNKDDCICLAERLITRIRSLEIHEKRGTLSSTQKETLSAFRIAVETIKGEFPGSVEWIY